MNDGGLLTRSKSAMSVKVLIPPLMSSSLRIRMQLPRNSDFRPPLSESQKSLRGVQARMKARVDAVPNARTKAPQARTIRRKGTTGKMRYWNETLGRCEWWDFGLLCDFAASRRFESLH